MTERAARWAAARWRALTAGVLIVALGWVIGWLWVGPLLVDRWVLRESPAVTNWDEQLLHRDVAMGGGAVAGAGTALAVCGLGVLAYRIVRRARTGTDA